MPVSDRDILRSAHVLIKQHGADATLHAAMKADRLLAAGDVEGAAVLKQTVWALNEVQSQEPPAGAARH